LKFSIFDQIFGYIAQCCLMHGIACITCCSIYLAHLYFNVLIKNIIKYIF